jgi:hypothetical protein
MKANVLIALGLLILLSVVATFVGIWHLSATAEFTRKPEAPKQQSP